MEPIYYLNTKIIWICYFLKLNIIHYQLIFRYSFRVSSCACPTVISSIFGKSFHFPLPYFVIFILRYFPFHVVHYQLINLATLLNTIQDLKNKINKKKVQCQKCYYSNIVWIHLSSQCLQRPFCHIPGESHFHA